MRIPCLLLLGLALGCSSTPASLEAMYAESRSETSDGTENWKDVSRARRKRIDQTVRWKREGKIESVQDHLYASAILLDSDRVEELEMAWELALEAGKQDERGFPLAAEAIDRVRMFNGEPQKYGTQFTFDLETGLWVLYPWDSSTTDAERTSMGVMTLPETLDRLNKLNSRIKSTIP